MTFDEFDDLQHRVKFLKYSFSRDARDRGTAELRRIQEEIRRLWDFYQRALEQVVADAPIEDSCEEVSEYTFKKLFKYVTPTRDPLEHDTW